MKKIRIAVVDDDDLFRKALVRIISTEQDLEVALQASDSKDLLAQHQVLTSVDIILMDIMMPEMNGTEASEKVSVLYPAIKIIALTHYLSVPHLMEMFGRGVRSFIAKGDIDELFKAIRIVNHGGAYVTDHSQSSMQLELAIGNISPPAPTHPNLTGTELQVLSCICQGLSSTDIGEIIQKSPGAVEKYREELYQKFGVSNEKELIEVAQGWVSGEGCGGSGTEEISKKLYLWRATLFWILI